MPYTKQERRFIGHRSVFLPEKSVGGDLSFAIAALIEMYREEHGDSWQTFSDIYGAVEGAVDEFKRTVVWPYEDTKRVEHGQIFRPIERRG